MEFCLFGRNWTDYYYYQIISYPIYVITVLNYIGFHCYATTPSNDNSNWSKYVYL
jgi:hypothetical protein